MLLFILIKTLPQKKRCVIFSFIKSIIIVYNCHYYNCRDKKNLYKFLKLSAFRESFKVSVFRFEISDQKAVSRNGGCTMITV